MMRGATRRRFVPLAAGFALAAASLASCSTDPTTGFLVRISSQLPVQRVLLRVYDSKGETATCKVFDVKSAENPSGFPLPASLGLSPEPGGDRTSSVRVVALAFIRNTPEIDCTSDTLPESDVRAEVIVSYVPNQIIELPLAFTLSCLDALCTGGSVCRYGECGDPRIDASLLTRIEVGNVDGTGCYSLDACKTSVPLSQSSATGSCEFPVPSNTAFDTVVPYVTYAFEDGGYSGAEFLSSGDYTVNRDAQSLRLSEGLCISLRSGFVRDVGLAYPCSPIRTQPVCPETLDPATKRVSGNTNVTPPPDASTDSASDARADASIDAQPDATVGDADSGVEASSDGSTPSSDSGSDANDAATGPCADCCGRCITVPTPHCASDVGAVLARETYGGVAATGDEVYWLRESSPGMPQLTSLRMGASTEVTFGAPTLGAFDIVTVGTQWVVVFRSIADVAGDVAIDVFDTSRPQTPAFSRTLSGYPHAPYFSSDAEGIYGAYSFSASGHTNWVAQRMIVGSPNPTSETVPMGTEGVDGSVIGIGASGGVSAIAFRVAATTRMTAANFFTQNVVGFDQPGLDMYSVGGLVGGFNDKTFLFGRNIGSLSSIHEFDPAATSPFASIGSIDGRASGLLPITQAANSKLYAMANDGTSTINMRVYPGATTPFITNVVHPASLRRTTRCLVWQQDGTSGRVVRATALP